MGTILRHSRLALIRGRTGRNTGTNSTLVALQERQNQWFMTTDFATPVFGIKAKPLPALMRDRYEFCHPRFWNQGKAQVKRAPCPALILPPPFLESRQSNHSSFKSPSAILPPPFLESRQSDQFWPVLDGVILPPPFLESRQSRHGFDGHAIAILPPPFLESRQSPQMTRTWGPLILPPPFLESRQSQVNVVATYEYILPPPFLESRQS